MRPLPSVLLPLVTAPLLVAAALRFGHDPTAAAPEWIHRHGGFIGAQSCRACHPDHYDSWRATFHSTMTQRPTSATVVGAFDGGTVRCGDQQVRLLQRDGRYWMELTGASDSRTAAVALVVGSRRYQQYFERQRRGDTEALVRLPVLWHMASQRWLPLDTVFLEPDGKRFEAHAAIWNENCIFCHNTAPAPGVVNYRDPARLQRGSHFDSHVGDLGIACESCHGPGQAHAAALRAPLARYRLHFGGNGDPAIVDPARLDQERAVSICGQCHGARLPEPKRRIADWLTTGPTFRAGARLREHVAPITAATPVYGNADPELFRLRFWGDGTPRLTAYEFQGVVASACYLQGAMTCQSCHAMHGGDARGQLRPDRPGNAMCTQCHAAIGRDLAAHTHHRADGAGSVCVDCHMPRVVYGVAEIHRSHRIESPVPQRDAAAGRPHACTLCHVDRTLQWAAEQLPALWGSAFAAPGPRRDGAPAELPDAIASLHAGDAAVRAVYAAALGRPTAVAAPAAAGAIRAHLAVAMGDGYPMVRWLAQRSLQAIETRAPIGLHEVLLAVDHTMPAAERRRSVFGVLDALAARAPGRLPAPPPGWLLATDFRLDLPAVVRLTNLQAKNPISIGE